MQIEGLNSTMDNTAVTPQPRVFLQPIAAPSILGLFGLAGATFIVAAHMAGWFGSLRPMFFVPFVAMFGGLAQFLAGMWAFRARDGIATAVHGTWGATWIAYGLLAFLVRGVTPGALDPELGYWFIVLAAVTWACTGAAIAENKAMVTLLTFLSAASTLTAIGLLGAIDGLLVVAGYLFLISALAAWYTGTALLLNDSFGREVWKLGRSAHARMMPRVTAGIGEPGVIRGQA